MTFARSAVAIAALVAVLAGAWLEPRPLELWRLALAVAVITVAQLLRLRFRVNATVYWVGWGEAAAVIGLYLLPAGWLPLAGALATLAALTVRQLFTRDRFTLGTVAMTVGVLTLAATAAAGISVAIAQPYAAPLAPVTMVGLILGALGYLVVSTFGISAITSLRQRTSVWQIVGRLLSRKLLMFVGNVAVGLTVVALLAADPRWLLALPPALWLLHQTYANRLRASEDRRAWTAFAGATRSLNQLAEDLVAVAGVRGALDVFSVGHAEVQIRRPDGSWHRWAGDHTGEVSDGASPDRPAATQPGAVPLLVGGEEIGVLRVDFPASTGPAHRETMALQAYADALAAALHDAATHHELRDRVSRAAHDAQHDPATGLLNRAAMLSRGETSLLAATADAALLLLDIKRFREINDTLGHSAGDEVLRVAARRLRAAAGTDELLGRLGGDEFALLLTGVPAGPGDPTRRAQRRARDLVEELAVPAEISGVPLSVEVSVGVVTARAGTIDMIELLRRADVALHQAKRGGGPVAAYDSARDSGSTDRLALLAELRAALAADDELVLLLQPAVDLATGGPVAVEALVRWNHPRRGRLLPKDFVRTVENSDLLGAFTRRVLDRALAAAASWAEDGTPVPVAVNLSARSLLDSRLPAEVGALLRRHRVPPRRLVLEITETVMMSELAVIDEVLAGLRALGVQLAVDDFGTGFSSLSFLTRIPVDEVKVDRSFVTRMLDSTEAAAIVRATVELGRDLGVRVVAEGVETLAQRRLLAQLGCTAAQGHLFAEPLPADQIGAALRNLTAAAGAAAPVLPLATDTAPG